MSFAGGCYCGATRYVTDGEPTLRAQCHCRECQYFTGGGPNYFMMMPAAQFRFIGNVPASFTRHDLDRPVTRHFCPHCGTHLATTKPGLSAVIVKIGTLDDPARFIGPDMAIYLVDRQPFHLTPEGLPAFERMSGAR